MGDFIEVTPTDKDKGTYKDFGAIRGTALDERGYTGWSDFRIRPNGTDMVLNFNLNFVEVKNLFRVT